MTEEQKQRIAWQDIYASKRNGKILHSEIIGLEPVKLDKELIWYAVLNYEGIKVVIPVSEVVNDETEDATVIVNNMIGAKISFIVKVIQKDDNYEVGASRNLAMEKTREIYIKKCVPNNTTYANIVGVWRKFIRLECLGTDFIVEIKDLQYGFVENAQKIYKINDQIKVVLKEVDKDNNTIKIGVKDLLEDPYKNIRRDIVEKGKYSAKITGYCDTGRNVCKYKAGRR